MFTRKKITIPAAGKRTKVNVEGCAVQVESAGVYSSPEQVPLLIFEDSSGKNPIYPQAVFNYCRGFSRFEVEGTDESAGDEVYLLVSDSCMEQRLSSQTVSSKLTTIGTTFPKVATDNAQSYDELELVNAENKLPNSVYISAAGGDIYFSFRAEPTAADYHKLTDGEFPREVRGLSAILNLKFIDAVSGTSAKLITTPEY